MIHFLVALTSPQQFIYKLPSRNAPLQTNEYWKHCTTTYASEAEASRHNQTAEHRKENGIHGNARTPDGGYTITHLLGAIGITLMSAIVDTKCISLFWSISPNYNFPRVRNCMKRDYYYLIYSRHLRFEKSPGPGPEDAEYDTKYQIRQAKSLRSGSAVPSYNANLT